MELINRMDGRDVPVLKKEIYRYLGYTKILVDNQVDQMIDKAIEEAVPLLAPACVHNTFPVAYTGDETDLGFVKTSSADLIRNLRESEEIILIAATIGPRYDIQLNKYNRTNAVMAAIYQAMGAMFVESYLDLVNEELGRKAMAEGKRLRPRFSPGYGDLPLELQRSIFKVLRMDRIGLALNDSLLMSPSKSVTAIIGVEKNA